MKSVLSMHDPPYGFEKKMYDPPSISQNKKVTLPVYLEKNDDPP